MSHNESYVYASYCPFPWVYYWFGAYGDSTAGLELTLENICKSTTIPMYTKLTMRTVFGWILKPALSSEKYFMEDPFFDITII
jgi:hypothetical protein